MKLKSFGCSFIFGSDLSDGDPCATYSRLTWPALIAKETNSQYECYAWPGSGNLQILERVLSQAALSDPDDLFVIGWTWIDRFDYTTTNDNWKTILPVDTSKEAEFYYRNLHSQFRDKFATLIHIRTAISVLKEKKIPFIMTYMDELIFETEWHATQSIIDAQEYIRPWMSKFEGLTFLDWSRSKDYKISNTLHPLETAHAAAAQLMLQELRLP